MVLVIAGDRAREVMLRSAAEGLGGQSRLQGSWSFLIHVRTLGYAPIQQQLQCMM